MNTASPKSRSAKLTAPSLHLAFDVGHSSLGWAVLEKHDDNAPGILGCGVVIFRPDDCLASQRRGFRRQRRHIRATRQRISRLKRLLGYLGVLTTEQLEQPGCAWPWLLAARVLRGGTLLTWPEMWDVLRWYAHNRGYDGNRRWSALEAEAENEDTEKVQNAHTLMEKFGAKSMAETVCAVSGLDPLGSKRSANIKPSERFKAQNAAFPREVVEKEVRAVLTAHIGKLARLDEAFIKALFEDWRTLSCPDITLPKRYQGGLLFGQLVPRFDNRIISECPVSGDKVPSRNCREFFDFRWGMQLANIRLATDGEAELRPLNASERAAIDAKMRERGSLTASELKQAVRGTTHCVRDNLETMLMHPDVKEALVVDPVKKLVTSDKVAPFWNALPERLQKRFAGQLRRGRSVSLASMQRALTEIGESTKPFDAAVEKAFAAATTKGRKKDKQISREGFLAESFGVAKLPQRAAYSRETMARAFVEVMAGKHPKEEGGSLFITEQMRTAQLNRAIAEQTNNHLVRHRLLILQRLVHDIVKEYAADDKSRIARITIEVNRDLREMSGKTNKEKAQDMGLRLANFKSVVKKLEADESFMRELNRRGLHRIPPGLIRKARIAEDLSWTCPYTGQQYEPIDLLTKRVDKDHIVPRSERMSDALESLVMTFSAVNKWKGKRTALKFVEDEQCKPVPNLPNLSIVPLSDYKKFVEGLSPKSDPVRLKRLTGHTRPIDDDRRRWKRKQLLMLPAFEEKEFVPGDLTQTSQLVRLGAQAIQREFLGGKNPPVITSMPGSVTGTLRKGWNRNLLGCLSTSCPQVLDENGEIKNKTDIRDITHLHHALDGIVLGLADCFIPRNGRIWEMIVKRRLDDSEKAQLRALGIFDFSPEGFGLKPLPEEIEKQVRARLAEKRVVQHVPVAMDGLRVEQNTWRVVSIDDGEATIQQRPRDTEGNRIEKRTTEKVGKLLGVEPTGSGKLKTLKGALVIPENYGVALDPEPVIIPFHKVWSRLQKLKQANGGKMPRLLRNGQLFHVPRGNFKGTWRVFSAKNNASGMALDIGRSDVVRLQNKTEGHKINVRLMTLLRDGLTILKTPLTGTNPDSQM